MRNAASKLMWAGRATVFMVGLAMTLALVLGVSTTALAAIPGDPFRLGAPNAIDAISSLVGDVTGPMLRVTNNDEGTGATALELRVQPGKAPMKVNSGAKVAQLNADKVDGKDSSEFLGKSEKAADSAHADRADHASSADSATSANSAGDANTLDGKDSTEFLGKTEKAADADKLDGLDSTQLKPLTASVSDNASDLWGSGAVSASHLNTGSYEVKFNRNVFDCPRIASLGRELSIDIRPSFAHSNPDIVPSGEITVYNASSIGDEGTRLGVLTRDSAGNLVDRAFHLVVFC